MKDSANVAWPSISRRGIPLSMARRIRNGLFSHSRSRKPKQATQIVAMVPEVSVSTPRCRNAENDARSSSNSGTSITMVSITNRMVPTRKPTAPTAIPKRQALSLELKMHSSQRNRPLSAIRPSTAMPQNCQHNSHPECQIMQKNTQSQPRSHMTMVHGTKNCNYGAGSLGLRGTPGS